MNDLISRQAVNEIINDIRDCISVEGYWAILERMKKLPPVNPQEPKTGHWIANLDKWGDIVTTVNGYKCSECGEFDGFRDKFCPNCGCRMVKPKESEEI